MNFNGIIGTQQEENPCACMNLSRTQRLYGFGICFAVGFVLSLLSTLMLTTMNITGFAVLYTFGNIVSLLSTGFLIGFLTQFKKMFEQTRIIATCVFLGFMIMTFVSAFAIKSVILTLFMCLGQFLALFWYSISYIPFARDAIKGMFGISRT